MKKLVLVIVILAAFFAFYLPKDNSYKFYFKILSIIILMVGVMRLMSKVPSKNQPKDDNDVS